MTADAQEKKRPRRKPAEQLHKHDVRLDVPLVGTVTLPPPEQLAFYAGVGTLAVLEIIEWPVALVLAAGHALAHNRHNQIINEFGEALEAAG